MRLRDRRVRTFLVATISAALAYAVNRASQLSGDSLFVQISIWVAVVVLISISAFLGPVRRRPSRLQLKTEAAGDLHVEMQRRWESDPAWRRVSEDGRLPIRWELADTEYFRASKPAIPFVAGHSSGSAGTALEDLWLSLAPQSRLVLLGEAGSGKSELLMALFQSMLMSWERGKPFPLLVSVASWNPYEQTLRAWLADWLKTNYRFLGRRVPGSVRQTMADSLLDGKSLAIILDGFDELDQALRQKAIQDINIFSPNHHVLLSSRAGEYRSATHPEDQPDNLLKNEVCIRLLDQEPGQVLDYLKRRSPVPGRWDGVEQGLQNRPDLAEVLSTPLMVMLAHSIYNNVPAGRDRIVRHPDTLMSVSGRLELQNHLLSGFVTARYSISGPGEPRRRSWTPSNAVHWLGFLARMLGDKPDLKWWDLPVPSSKGTRQSAAISVTAVLVLVWTALSAGVLNGWVFSSAAIGITDAVRISAAALICYLVMLYLTGSYGGSILAALGAYIAGTLSGSFDLALGAGLIAGFSWRPLALRRAGLRHAALAGAVVVAALMSIRGLGILFGLPLHIGLTQGFAAGALDGFASRWDEDVNGWIGSGTVAAIIAWSGIQVTPRAQTTAAAKVMPGYLANPACHGLIAGILVTAINSWADGFRPDVTHPWLIAPADGLAVGLAVWYASFWGREAPWLARLRTEISPQDHRHTPWYRQSSATAIAMAGVTTGLNILGHNSRADIHNGWARALAEGICVGLLTWFALDYRQRRLTGRHAEIRPATAPRMPLLRHLRLAAPALISAVTVGMLDGLSARPGRAVSAGIAAGLLVLFWSYRRHGIVYSNDDRALSRRPEDGGWKVDPVEAGLFATVIVGLIAGFGYGLMFGVVAGLASRVSRDIWKRSQPARRPLPSLQGIAGGVLLGSVVVLGASFNGIPAIWLAAIGITSGIAGAFAFGVEGEDLSTSPAASPYTVFTQDRMIFLGTVALIAVALGIAVGARALAGDEPTYAGVLAAVSTIFTYGLTAGLVIAASATRFGTFAISKTWLAAKGDLPWKLMSFLNDAHLHRGVLRSNGAVYQFRHQYLKEEIASRASNTSEQNDR